MLFDTHAHLEDDRFKEDQQEVIQRAKDTGLSYIMNIGCDLEAMKKTVRLAEKYPFIYAGIGMHPHDAKDADEEFFKTLDELSKHPKVKAIGEMGLDYYYDNSPREIQREIFRKQIRFAKEKKLPIIVHDREAHQDSLDIIRQEKASEVGGVFHAFSGSLEMAELLFQENFLIAIGGTVTFKNAKRVVRVVENVGLENIILETDCPYLTPVPFRGKRNEPSYVRYVAEKIGEIKGLDWQEVAEITTKNAKRLFQIED